MTTRAPWIIAPLRPSGHDMALAITARCWPNNERAKEILLVDLNMPETRWTAALTPGGRIVAFAGWHCSPCCASIAEMMWCNVEPEFQGRGVGRLLFEARERAIIEAGYKQILLTTHLIALYEKYGFRPVAVVEGLTEGTRLMIKLNVGGGYR